MLLTDELTKAFVEDDRYHHALYLCNEFIDTECKVISKYNRENSTYGWKHIVEKWARTKYPKNNNYVPEYTFIYAVISRGIAIKSYDNGYSVIKLSVRNFE